MVVYDSAHPDAANNWCFSPESDGNICSYITIELGKEGKRRGLDLITADTFLARAERPTQVLGITDRVTRNTKRLFENGMLPTICWSFEAPLKDHRFFHKMTKLAGRYQNNIQFRGTLERLKSTDSCLHTLHFPIDTRHRLSLVPWEERQHLVMVNANKRTLPVDFSNPGASVKTLYRWTRYLWWRQSDPWLCTPELYSLRIRAIRHFADQPGFQLFGIGWDQPSWGLNSEDQLAIKQCYVGSLPSGHLPKRQTVSEFKFALCFENCVFPGYVTEKIFDCLLAGTIPIYYGAPDISEFVPPGCFIDFRQFDSFDQLDRYIYAMSESRAFSYFEAADEFLSGPDFAKFHVDTFVSDVCNILQRRAGELSG